MLIAAAFCMYNPLRGQTGDLGANGPRFLSGAGREGRCEWLTGYTRRSYGADGLLNLGRLAALEEAKKILCHGLRFR